MGFATKPNGWSLRHAFLQQNETEAHFDAPYVCPYRSSCNLLMQSDMVLVLIGLRRGLFVVGGGVLLLAIAVRVLADGGCVVRVECWSGDGQFLK